MLGREDSRQRAAQYRHRAEELRTIAQDWTTPEARQSLVRVAMEYERMADVVESAVGWDTPDPKTLQ